MRLSCLRYRKRIERLLGDGLAPGPSPTLSAHLEGCADCAARAEALQTLRRRVAEGWAPPGEPDWAGFWPAVHRRILTERVRPVRDPWWLPIWKPVWGHPRLALGAVATAAGLVAFGIWPPADPDGPQAWAAPVTVQDVGTADPQSTVMVYSDRTDNVTVIWVFAPEASREP
jgi:hypothetical protein